MSVSIPHHVPFHRYGPQKTCPDCQAIVPAKMVFCPNCSRTMRAVPENVRSVDGTRAQFRFPALLTAEPGERRFDEQGIGTGLIWVGLALLAVPFVGSNLSPLSIGAWSIGLLLSGFGIARARRDGRAMLHAGMVTAAAGLLVLLFVGNQILRHENLDMSKSHSIVAMTPAAEIKDVDVTEQSLHGRIPMYRGSPFHTGMVHTPALAGMPYRAWRYETGGALQSTPAIANGVAYIGTRDGRLLALDLTTQRPRWSFDLNGYPVRSSPAVVDGTVYLANGFAIFAIDAETGRQRWKSVIGYAGESSPVVVDGVVYIAAKERYLYAFDANDGEQIWTYKTNGLLFGSPSVNDTTIVIGGDNGEIVALDRENAHLLWKLKFDAGIYSTPAIDEDRVYIPLRNKTTVAIDLESGTQLWLCPVGGTASPAVGDGIVYIPDNDGALYAIDAKTGTKTEWLYATGQENVRSPMIVDDQVLFTAGPTITSLNKETGELLWEYPLTAEITNDLVALDGYLFVGDKNGSFTAITGDAALGTPDP